MKRAINAIIIQDKKLLLFRKNLTWILPGGKPEKEESHIETLVREFKEEASDAEIEVKEWEYYGHFRSTPSNKKDSLEIFVYFAKLKNPRLKIIPSGEIKEIKFIGYQDSIPMHLSDITNKVMKQLTDEGYL